MKNKYTVTVKGFSSKEEAEEFINWYSGSGEQDSEVSFEERKREGLIEHSCMMVDRAKTWCYENHVPGTKLKFTDSSETNVSMTLVMS